MKATSWIFTAKLPADLCSGSMLSAAVNGVGDCLLSGLSEWPEGDVPESITLPEGREVYPALCAEGDSVGRQVFMDQREAEYEHKHGLVKLFSLLHAQQVKYLKKSYKLSPQVQLALCVNDQEKQYEEDFIYSVIISALTDEIHSEEEFEERSQIALGEMGLTAQNHLDALERIFEQYEQIRSLLDKVGNRAENECNDVRQQLDFLFRPGFLTNETIWKNYPRYLRALQLRTERLNSSPTKDYEKMQPLAPFIERFRLSLMAVDNFEKAFDLFDFWLSFEELRIAAFAPEVQTTEKISPKRLQKKWEELRL